MRLSKLIEMICIGAFIGCFIGLLVMVLISSYKGLDNLIFNGYDVVNLFCGSIIIGWGFSLSALIYEKDDIILPFQIIFQMIIGMSVLFLVAIYLNWMPITLGWIPIVTWIVISCVFAIVFWCGFYIYYLLVARELNKKLNNSKFYKKN